MDSPSPSPSQTVLTHFLPPTNRLNSRIVARSSGGGARLVVSWEDAQGVQWNHTRAALLLARRLGWLDSDQYPDPREYHLAGTKEGYALVFTSEWSRVDPEAFGV